MGWDNVNLYGRQRLLRDGLLKEDGKALTVGAAFFAAALRRARLLSTPADPDADPEPVTVLQVNNIVKGRLFRGLASLAMDLKIAGTSLERNFSGHTYDLASILLEKSVANARASQSQEVYLLPDRRGQSTRAAGVVHVSDKGIIGIRSVPDSYPNTIVLTIATVEENNDTIFARHYIVQPRATYLGMMTHSMAQLGSNLFDADLIEKIVIPTTIEIPTTAVTALSALDEGAADEFERNITSMIIEGLRLPAR